ncbi:DUF2935 domain-containing protein [Xylanibacillus composti]|uniref:DUF2935 domain-containing protein n=1 Tax=Xylanibacillus composti TaxID=1572762 RepID=A0A8J4GZM9_9BACL|nr:DUF2935 domain-containing protein [Xylanibacillus composti]MDT9724922.1 DUF2935 domain-containing protein [Xylanibacillus composti]GIQ68158.1 DUF2935 domain-containing protein [Xylanibacillus composti]
MADGKSPDTAAYDVEKALFEHRFWLQILGDHARFIESSMPIAELKEIEQAQAFITLFDSLLGTARRRLPAADTLRLTQEALQAAQQLRAFKLHLLSRHLQGDLRSTLPPTFYNHMVNEIDEYIRILAYLTVEKTPPLLHPVHHHLIWLLDASGHAASIHDQLDPVEADLRNNSDMYKKKFDAFYLKAVEMAGYLRTGLTAFPALHRFNRQVDLEMKLFQGFLAELVELNLTGEALDVLTPLMPDHMYREECYYLIKLAETSGVKPPECDPTKPRVQE